MKLRLNKAQQVKGFSQKISYSLTAKVELTEEERQHLHKYKLSDLVVYSKERITPEHVNYGSARGIMRNLSAAALNLKITVYDLTHGRTIVCKNIDEIMDVEATMMQSCQALKNILTNCAGFEGEQIIEF